MWKKTYIFIVFLLSCILFGQVLDLDKIKRQSKPENLGVSGSAVQSGAAQIQSNIEKFKTAQKQASQKLQQLQYTPLDGVIDGDKYIIGPNDVLRIQIWSAITIDELVSVTPDGMAVIPGYGPVEIGGLKWNDGKKKILDEIEKAYHPKRFAVTLASVRVFWANITGAVKFPGGYQLAATQRLWDLVQLAGGTDGIADLTNIKIFKRNGDTITVDMTRYFADGDIDYNPYLFDGDVVFIPPVNGKNGIIRIFGTGIRSGFYGLEGDETVRNIAQRLGVFTQSSEFTNVQVIRGNDVIAVNMLTEDIPLENNDVVIFPAHLDSIIVGGLVMNGGAFPYYPNFSPYAYIALAGGPTEKGTERRITIYRNGKKISLGENDMLKPGDVIIVNHSVFDRFKDLFESVAKVVSASISVYYLVDRLTR